MKYKYNSILQYAEKNNFSKKDVYFSLLARESLITNGIVVLFDNDNQKFIKQEIIEESKKIIDDDDLSSSITFLLERYSNQKDTGTYYTPSDVTNFMSDYLTRKYRRNMTILDPTSGTGSLLFSLIKKINIKLKYIYAYDLDEFAITILKQRLFTYFWKEKIPKVKKIINQNIQVRNILNGIKVKADLIISNPPYFELKKSEGAYGNIYADALHHMCNAVTINGFISIIIPISFQSTKRMEPLREIVKNTFSNIDLYSFADRPDSLFKGVHQKLNILNASVIGNDEIRTSNYLMWRTSNRKYLFHDIELISSKNLMNKIGNKTIQKFYDGITSPIENINAYLDPDGTEIFISGRLAQYSKAFIKKQEKGEYVSYKVKSKYAKQLVAIFNSNSYFIYWTIVSDGWHNTKKIIENFKITESLLKNTHLMTNGNLLLKALEVTKEYIGSVQIEYIYKHSKCISEINKIDEIIMRSIKLSKLQINKLINFEKGVKHE